MVTPPASPTHPISDELLSSLIRLESLQIRRPLDQEELEELMNLYSVFAIS